jgi:hypothetical protein
MTAIGNRIGDEGRGQGSVAVPGTPARFLKPCRAGLMAAVLALLVAEVPDVRAGPVPRTLDLAYEVYAGGLLVADSDFSLQFLSGRFDARFTMEPRGISALLKKFRLQSQSDGLMAWHRVEPSRFRTEYWKKDRRHRWVQIDYGDDPGPEVEAVPAPKKDRRAEVPETLRSGALDPISAALVLSDRVGRAGRCEAALDIFDGRRFFRVGLEDLGSVEIESSSGGTYRGPALKCRMNMEKVTGFSDKELKKGRYPETMTALLAQVVPGGPWLPIRLEADHSLGRMVVNLISVEGQGFEPQRASRR